MSDDTFAIATQISIGRNAGIDRMILPHWRQFQGDIKNLFGVVVAEVRGVSVSKDWGTEDSYSVIGELDTWVKVDVHLPQLATFYRQDAIAIGEVRLVP